MKVRIRHCVTPAIVLGVVVFLVRERTLHELRVSNRLLHEQLEAQAALPPAVPSLTAEPAPTGQSTNPVVALSPDERSELIRLRGQYLPLRDELFEKSNRVVMLTQSAPQRVPAPSRQLPTQPADTQTDRPTINAFMKSELCRSAQTLSLALRDYVKAHAGELPTDLAQLEALARRQLPAGASQQFELILSGTLPEEAWPQALIARQKEPQQLADGRWVRIYLNAGGWLTYAGLADTGDWPALERRRNEAVAKLIARKKQANTQP